MGDDVDSEDPRPMVTTTSTATQSGTTSTTTSRGRSPSGQRPTAGQVTTGCLRSRPRRRTAIPMRPSVSPFASRRGRSTNSTSMRETSHQMLAKQGTAPSVGSAVSRFLSIERDPDTASDRVTQTATPTCSVRRSGTMDSSRVSTGRQR